MEQGNTSRDPARTANEPSVAGVRLFPLQRREDGRLLLRRTGVKGDETQVPVKAVSAFPWSRPGEFISIRDDKGHELELIERLSDVEPAARRLIEEELAQRNFLPRVVRVDAVISHMEFFHWKVQTNAGPRWFLTSRHERPRVLPNGSVLIKDIGNDLLLIENPKSLDPRSLKLLWVYLD